MLKRIIIFYPVKDDQLLEPEVYGEHISDEIKETYTNHEERAVARWVLVNNKNAGVSTSTLPGAKGLYLTIRKRNQVFAVLGIAMEQHEDLPPYEKALLKAILNEVALAIDSTLKQGLQEQLDKHVIVELLEQEDM